LPLDSFFQAYLAGWIAACVIAAAMVALRPALFSITTPAYWRYLAVPWKVASFAVAAAGITLIAPHTGDPTWDYYDALLMSALTFTTAPWAVGTLWRVARGRATWAQAYVAACLMLLSASWCYDAYLLWRDGMYPITWFANLVASSILYLLAGMLWNLEWRPGRGATFGFLEADWPNPALRVEFRRLLLYALPLMLLACALILPFLWGGWG
jgi:hypothetical protein